MRREEGERRGRKMKIYGRAGHKYVGTQQGAKLPKLGGPRVLCSPPSPATNLSYLRLNLSVLSASAAFLLILLLSSITIRESECI